MDNRLILGDCLEKMKEFPDNSIDAIVTDPPYELGFMGKKWDNTGIAYNTNLWKEALRVLKPGGHLLAFGGTRTYHRMAVAIEDAGFEVRDMLEYIYASGFPKSLNVGKSIESKITTGSCAKNNFHKLEGKRREGRIGMYDIVEEQGFRKNNPDQLGAFDLEPTTELAKQWEGFGTALKPSHETVLCARKPFTLQNEIDIMVHIITKSLCQLLLNVKTAEKNLASSQQEQMPSIAQWIAENNINILEDLLEAMVILQSGSEKLSNLSIVSLWKNTLEELYKVMNISIISTEINLITELRTLKSILSVDISQNITQANDKEINGVDISALTVAHIFTAELKKLSDTLTGFVKGVAISQGEQKDSHHKAHEPIILARKPLSEKTIVENVLKYGTGAIDIDGCRIPTSDGTPVIQRQYDRTPEHGNQYGNGAERKSNGVITQTDGRFPANIICTDDALNDGVMTKGSTGTHCSNRDNNGKCLGHPDRSGAAFGLTYHAENGNNVSDSGSKSRYFNIDVWGEKYGLLQFPKASKKERNDGCDRLEEKETKRYGDFEGTPEHAPKKDIKNTNHHPTVKPVHLMSWLVRLVSREGDTVLDPFMGSGTTGVACAKLGRSFIGIELNEEYIKIAECRIEKQIGML